MKKITSMLVLVFALNVSVFAEGEYPIGGKNCPQGQVCRIANEIPTGTNSENPIVKNIFDFLISIFG